MQGRGEAMFEKVNPCHPDKVADRIAGALVDAAYRKEENPRIAVEVLIGHGVCHIIAESSVHISQDEVDAIVKRIGGNLHPDYVEVPQDGRLANNQAEGIRCGDNGIFKGMPVTEEQKALCEIAKNVYHTYPSDGKYIIDEARLILCQSNAPTEELKRLYPSAEVNPLGDWTGGTDVDSGAANRKLGSDMADMKRSRHSLMRSPRRSPTKLTAKSCWSSSSTQLRVKRQSRSLMNGCGRVWWIS